MPSLKSPPKATLVINAGEKISRDKLDPNSHTEITLNDPSGKKSSYSIMGTLGRGAFGKVSKAINSETGTVKAIKKVKLAFKSSEQLIEDIEALEKEAQVGACADFTKALLFFPKAAEEKNYIAAYMVSEFCPGIDLQKFIQEGKYAPEEFLIIMRGMFGEMNRLHKLGIIHADFKPANFIVNEDLTVKIVDYGFATFQDDENKEARGTPRYSPGELFTGADVTQKGDIYSTGITAAEGLRQVHEEPITVNSKEITRLVPNSNMEKDLAKACPKLSSKQVKILADLLQRMTKQSPDKRLSPEDFDGILATYDREILKIPPVSQIVRNVSTLLDDVIFMLERRILKASPIEKQAIKDTLGELVFTPEQLKHPKTLYALREKIASATAENCDDFTFARQIMGEFRHITKQRLSGNKFTTECTSKFDSLKKLVNQILPVEPWNKLSVARSVAAAREEVEKQYQHNFRNVHSLK
ncbi:protein kinase domain-containing protein [Legionella brunensis]|uniref:Serine/threonine-protein kinase n=1 Tax=Legionella brunensis TaxID=29422 RepID=A0A0W0SV13_9GAMM|nr:protein kinase [Legionella brunensis]KTC87184.1 serine/threonine-protein kinase [Legionella brunensis]